MSSCLGLAALLFGFALYPFMSTMVEVDEGIARPKEHPVWGIQFIEDFTDIPVEIEVSTSLPTDVNSIEIFIIENAKVVTQQMGLLGK